MRLSAALSTIHAHKSVSNSVAIRLMAGEGGESTSLTLDLKCITAATQKGRARSQPKHAQLTLVGGPLLFQVDNILGSSDPTAIILYGKQLETLLAHSLKIGSGEEGSELREVIENGGEVD